jgi:lipid-A-disaccharide synthase
MPKILISCGEPSGDLYAGALATAIRTLSPDATISGLGGDCLAAAHARLIGEYRQLTATGLLEVVSGIPRLLGMFRRMTAVAREERPDVLVAIDFPEFNLRLASAMRKLGVPVVYYVSPQLWAWRPHRIRTVRRVVDRMLVIFPFEENIYRAAGVDVEFVGHPLVELAHADASRAEFLGSLGLDPTSPTIAVLPGSRPNEVRALLPALCRAAVRVGASLPRAQFVVARASNLDASLFETLMRPADRAAFRLVEGRPDTVLASSDVAVVASGTATVQAAIHGTPMVVVYRLAPLTYKMGKPFVHVDTYGMVNLVAGRRIVPELIQDDFTPESVTEAVLRYFNDPSYAQATKAALADVRTKLGEPGASERAARAVLNVARRHEESAAAVQRSA